MVLVPSTVVLIGLTVISRWTYDAVQTIVDDVCQLLKGIMMIDCKKTPANLLMHMKMMNEIGTVKKTYLSLT
jgi:hypothetical protein